MILLLAKVLYYIITPGCFFSLIPKIDEALVKLVGNKTELSRV